MQKQQRHAALAAQFDEMRRFQRALREQDAVIAENADRDAVDMGEAGHQRRAVERLELVEFGRIDQPRDHLAHVVLLFKVGRHDAVELGRRRNSARAISRAECRSSLDVEIADDAAAQRQRMAIILSEIIGDAGFSRMHVGAAKLFRA